MDRYYYFIAELPVLFFGKEPALPMTWFVEEAEKCLTPLDYQQLQEIHYLSCEVLPDDPPILQTYKQFEYELRSDIAALRHARKPQQDYKPSAFPLTLVKEGDPLTVEKNLLLFRWRFLESLEPSHHFDFAFIIIYYLKLQLLQKFFTFDKEIGKSKYKLYTITGL